MADMNVKPSRIRDVVRDSKIRLDTPSMFKQRSDSLLPESYHANAGLRHNRTHDDHRVGRDFPRVSPDEVSRRFQHCNLGEANNFDDNEWWFHSYKETEDPFHGFYDSYGGSDSLVDKFKRNLPDFDGFWHTEDLMSWMEAIEDFFDEMNPPEHLKCKIVWYKMKGAAYYWWKQIQNGRVLGGKKEISSWLRMKNMLLNRFSPLKCSTKVPCEYKSVHGCSEEPKLIATKINSQRRCDSKKDEDVEGSKKDSGVQKNVENGDVTIGALRHDAYTEKTINIMRPGNGEKISKDDSSSECFADQQSKASVEVQPISFMATSNVLQGITINEQKSGAGHGVDRKHSFNTLEYGKELSCITKLDDAKDEQSWQQFHLKSNNTDVHVDEILMVYFDNDQFREHRRALTVNNEGCVDFSKAGDIAQLVELRSCLDLSFDPGGKWPKKPSVEGIYQSGVVSMGKQSSWSLYGGATYSHVMLAVTYGWKVDHGLCLYIQLCTPSDCLKHFVMEASLESCEHSPGTEEVVSELRFQSTCGSCDFLDPNFKNRAASMLIGKLIHGKCECAPSTYFILKLVSFLFDPGGFVCPIGTWRTCLRIIGSSTETIIFRIFLVDVRCRDWSFDMVCGCLIIFPLRRNVIVWAYHRVSTFKQLKWGMEILSTMPHISVLFYVTFITWKCRFMGFRGYKGIWGVLLRWTWLFIEASCEPFGIQTSILWSFTITVSMVIAIASTLMLVPLKCCIMEDAGKLCYRSDGVKEAIYTTLMVDYLLKFGSYFSGVRNIRDIGFVTARHYSLLWEHTCWYKSFSNKTQLCSYNKEEMWSLCVPTFFFVINHDLSHKLYCLLVDFMDIITYLHTPMLAADLFEVKDFVLGVQTKQLGIGLLWGRKFIDRLLHLAHVASDSHKSKVSRIGELLKYGTVQLRLAATKKIDSVGFSIYSTFEKVVQGGGRNGESYIFISNGHQDQKSYITHGRVILREGWNDENNVDMEMKFTMVEISVVIIDPCGNTWCKSGQSREFLKLFHNVVNGLDPPMDLDDATTDSAQIEDDFVILEEDGDDVV